MRRTSEAAGSGLADGVSYPVGKIDADSFRLCNTALKSLQAAIAMCKPGALFRDIGATIEPICTRNGCSVVRTYVRRDDAMRR